MGNGELVWPFFDFHKKDIEKYAEENELDFISDKTNEDISFDRNFIRKEITPLIEKRWPKYNENLKKFISNVNES
ncbi:MAG: ATP-binding protein [Pseudomonadota bacterium]|nr:ATP-binding protein [Pseudomonadota bacterium]